MAIFGVANRIKKVKFLACSVLVLLLAAGGFSAANHRWLAYRSLGVLYSFWDPWSEHGNVDFGPETPLQFNRQPLCLPLEAGLKRFFPNCAVNASQSTHRYMTAAQIDFQHEDAKHPRFKEFVVKSESVREGSINPFELSQRIRAITHHGKVVLPVPETDPLAYLNLARNGQMLTCRYFAVLFGAAALAEGYSYRLLGLSPDGSGYAHAVTEVYIPEQRKWILIDPDFNVAYKINGQWANAFELHDAWQQVKKTALQMKSTSEDSQIAMPLSRKEIEELTGVRLVMLGEAAENLRATNMFQGSCTGINLELFEYVFYSVGNDYLSGQYPPAHPLRARQYVLQADSLATPPAVCPEGYILREPESIYWPVGSTEAYLVNIEKDALTVEFCTYTPNFSHFEVNESKDHKWTKHVSPTYLWTLHEGENRLNVRSVNLQGLRGQECYWSIDHIGDASN